MRRYEEFIVAGEVFARLEEKFGIVKLSMAYSSKTNDISFKCKFKRGGVQFEPKQGWSLLCFGEESAKNIAETIFSRWNSQCQELVEKLGE